MPVRTSPRLVATAATLAVALLLQGCAATQTPYQRPGVITPDVWEQGAPVAAAPAAETPAAWWTAFGDPALTALVDGALARNNDLAAAAWRVREARIQVGLAAEPLTPTPSGSARSNLNRSLRNGDSSRGSGADLSLSYELGMWKRLASARDAAQWAAAATEQDRQAAAQALAATTAGLYWQLGYLNGELANADASLDYAQRTLALVRVQYTAGAAALLELREAEAAVASQQAARTLLVQQRTEARNALAILFDVPPGEAALRAWLPAEPQSLTMDALPTIAAGLPAALLGRRPDLRAAEMRLRQTLASGDATRASYYPSLTLTGSLGTSSASLLNLLSNPVAALGVGLSLPFLRQNEMKLTGQLTEAQYQQAVAGFRQTLYSAFADVENALSARRTYAERAQHLATQLDAQRTAERLYETRYRAGGVALQDWLDAQERRRGAEQAFASNRLTELTTQATLYQALGGPVLAPLADG